MMQVVGFGHKSRVGKDTIAGFLFTHLKLTQPKITVRKVGFADALKEVAYKLYAWDGMKHAAHYDLNPNERQVVLPTVGKTPVEIWIEVGNKMREVFQDTWLRLVLSSVYVDVLIITDVRFPNEAEMIQAHDGWLYRIDRPGYEGISSSDAALDDWQDWTKKIYNAGDLNALHQEAVAIADALKQRALEHYTQVEGAVTKWR